MNDTTFCTPPRRSRLDTQETKQISNVFKENPFLESPDRQTPSIAASTVSSLSNGSICRRPLGPIKEEDSNAVFVPPEEIAVTVASKTPDWLQDKPGQVTPPSPLWTGAPSPARHRPTLGRNRMFDSNFVLRKIDTEVSMEHLVPNLQTEYSSVMNQRCRRLRRNASSQLSIGSLVGVSSFVTDPTATESSLESFDQAFQQENDAQIQIKRTNLTSPNKLMGKNLLISPSKRSQKGKDFKQVFGKMSTPIRQMMKTDEQVELHPASGCLA